MDEGRLSEPPMLRLWQELQEMNPDFDKRGSKKSILPSSTMFSFLGLAASIGWMGSSADAAAAAAMAGGAAMVPTDSSDMINARIIIGNLLKNAAVVAQPITPNKLKPWASLSAAWDENKVSGYHMSRYSLLEKKRRKAARINTKRGTSC